MKRIVMAVTLMFAVGFSGSLAAGPFQDADAAFKRGDYGTTMGRPRPLADQGAARTAIGLVHHDIEDGAAAYGRGDYATAMRLWRPLADQGFARAQYFLGAIYFSGRGVQQNYVIAHMWFSLAAAGGAEDAARDRGIVAASMTPVQIAEAQKRAAEWRPKIATATPTQAAPTAEGPFEDGEATYGRGASVTHASAPQESTLVPRGRENPSFNCAQAKTAAARLICADAKLAQLDGELGIAFQKRKAQILPPDQSNLVAEQLSWIRERNARCELVGKDTAAIAVLGSSKPCMVNAIQQRIVYLALDATVAPAVTDGHPLHPSTVAPSGQEATGIASAEGEGNPSEEFLARGMVVSNSQETVDTDLSVGSLSTYCRYGLFGTPSFDRRSAIGDVIFRCTVRNVLIQKIKTVSVVLREHRLNNRMVALVEVGSNPDGSLFSNQEAIAGFKRIAEVVRNIGFVREIHPDGYHCHGDATDLRLPKFMRDPCEEATRAVPVEAYRGDGAAPVAVERPQAMAPAAPPTATSKAQRFLGTGFFVSKDGNALTNAHVVEGCRQISVNMEGQTAAAKVLARDDRNDLALLTTDLHPADLIHWRLAVRQGEDVVVYGFPLSGVLASGGNVAVGNVTALAGLGNDSRFLQISAPVQPGNSGGPLLDRNGTVVGIVVSKLNALEIASATGDIPQNVNFAIKASVAAAFLDAQRVAHAESAGVGALSTPDIAERAKSFTVQVVCVR